MMVMNNSGSIHDYFAFEHDQRKYMIIFNYWESEQHTALPLFLKFVETMRYIEG